MWLSTGRYVTKHWYIKILWKHVGNIQCVQNTFIPLCSNLIAQCKDKDHLRSATCLGIQICLLRAFYCTPLIKHSLLWPCRITITDTCVLLLPSTQFLQPVLHSCLTMWWGSSVWWQDEQNCVHELFHWNTSTTSAILKCYSTNHCLYVWFHIKSHCETTWFYHPTLHHHHH
jgi:hypothetical protein